MEALRFCFVLLRLQNWSQNLWDCWSSTSGWAVKMAWGTTSGQSPSPSSTKVTSALVFVFMADYKHCALLPPATSVGFLLGWSLQLHLPGRLLSQRELYVQGVPGQLGVTASVDCSGFLLQHRWYRTSTERPGWETSSRLCHSCSKRFVSILPSCHLLAPETRASSLSSHGLPVLPSLGVSPAAVWDFCTCSDNPLLNCLLSAFSFNSALDVSLSWYPPFSLKGFAPNSFLCHEGVDSHTADYFNWVAFFLLILGFTANIQYVSDFSALSWTWYRGPPRWSIRILSTCKVRRNRSLLNNFLGGKAAAYTQMERYLCAE